MELESSLPTPRYLFSPNTEPVHRLGNLSVRSGKNGPRVLTDAFYGCGKDILKRR